MSSYPALQEAIDDRLLRRWHRHGDRAARDRLASRCEPLVRSIARRYRDGPVEDDDVLQVGRYGLTKAIDGYDPVRGRRFVSYAVPTIQGEIRRHFRDATWATHVPRAMQELSARVERRAAELQRDHHAGATDQEIAADLAVDVVEVQEARRVARARTAGPLEELSDGRPGPLAHRGTVDTGYRAVENSDLLARAGRVLSDRERQVLRWRFDHDLLQREIAEKIGVSQMQVSRIIAAALERMQSVTDDPGQEDH